LEISGIGEKTLENIRDEIQVPQWLDTNRVDNLHGITSLKKVDMIMDRISWDQYFMAQSHLLALRSTRTRLMVGATIVRYTRIIAGGYNGSVFGCVNCIVVGLYHITIV